MRAFGIALSMWGGLMVLMGLISARIGKFDLSTTAGVQQFVGATAFGIIVVALGLKLANRKKSGPDSD